MMRGVKGCGSRCSRSDSAASILDSPHQRILGYEPWFSATIYCGLGVTAALTGRRAD